MGVEGEGSELENALNNLSETLEQTIESATGGPLATLGASGSYVREDAAWISNRSVPKLLAALGLATRFGGIAGSEAVVELMRKAAQPISRFRKLEENGVLLLHAMGLLDAHDHWAMRLPIARAHPELMTPLHARLLSENTIGEVRLHIPDAGQDELAATDVALAERAASRLVKLARV